MLLESFLKITAGWQKAFPQRRTFQRAVCQALGSLCCLGRRTITRIIWSLGRQFKVWSSEYFLHSRSHWTPDDLYKPIVEGSVQYCRGPLLGVVADDTSAKKTGTKIEQAFWSRDPMSPPFHTNFRLGIRFLQFAVVLPLHRTMQAACRTLPVLFQEVGAVKKPRRRSKDYAEKMKEYRVLVKTHNLSTRTVACIEQVRAMFDEAGAADKTLVIIGDGAFCNRRILSCQTERTHLLLRCRKDLQLCSRAASGRRFYDEKKFTPLQVLNDASIPWKQTRIFYGGRKRRLKYKEVTGLYWESGAKRRVLRLFVIASTHYRIRKTGPLERRSPGFLLTTLDQGYTTQLLQLYFDRWQIEVNHREEKDTLGLGQAQLHNPTAVPKQPALVVAAYSALLLAALNAFGPHRTDVYQTLPRWRKTARRPSCLDLLNLLRREIVQNTPFQREVGIQITFETLTAAAAA